ncbi:hypothetical protein HQ563_17145 [bacterium]|nr:hypothetical protein [bacterium]
MRGAKMPILAVAIAGFPFGCVLAHGNEAHEFAWSSLIVPLGITTFALVILTGCAGLFMRKKPKLLFKWHKRLAIITIVAAVCHAALVLLFHGHG